MFNTSQMPLHLINTCLHLQLFLMSSSSCSLHSSHAGLSVLWALPSFFLPEGLCTGHALCLEPHPPAHCRAGLLSLIIQASIQLYLLKEALPGAPSSWHSACLPIASHISATPCVTLFIVWIGLFTYLPDGSLSLDHRNRRLTWVSYSSLYSSTQGTIWYATDICWTIKQINNLIFPRWWWRVLNWHEFCFHFQKEITMKSTSVSDFKSQI